MTAATPTILVTGARGQLGYELVAALASHGRIVAVDHASLDLANADAIASTVRDVAPALIVNAAAYTAVDLAEKEQVLAHAVNARAPAILAEEAKRLGAALIHYSTDYVFDGTQRVPYVETAPTNPLGVYGASKLEGEQAIADSAADALVFRTSWVYGLRGKNFLLTIRRLAQERDTLRIVADQVGVPNWCRALASATATIVARGLPYVRERRGLYHMTSTGKTTWCDFARAIVGDNARTTIVGITTAEYPTPAKRPAYGVLDAAKFERAFGFALPPWDEALKSCVTSPAEPVGTVAVG